MQKRPDVSVKLILRCQGEILMLLRDDGTRDWPGGRLEWGETPEEALKRELVEELNYTLPATPKFLDIYNYISPDRARHSIFLHYFLEIDKKPEIQTTDEERDAKPIWRTYGDMKSTIKDPEFIELIFNTK